MKQTTDELIHKLTQDHKPRPWWKKSSVLLSIWFSFNLTYFLLTTIFYEDLILMSSVLSFSLAILSSLLGWLFFTRFLNDDNKKGMIFLGLLSFIALIPFFHDTFMTQTIYYDRGLSVTEGDWICFTHSLLGSLLPILAFPVLIKNFFVPKFKWMVLFFVLHTGLMGIVTMELKCHDRQFWHLIMGHQSSLLGMFALTLGLYLLMKKLTSAAP